MKKLVLILLVCLLGVSSFGQDVQTHYDLGKDRKFLTTTVEMFKPDKFGSTFFFIDMNYGGPGIQGVSLAYWEISRAITLFKSPFALHLEYNGGFGQFEATPFNGAYQINDAYLGGFEYSLNAKDFSKGITLQAMYKNIRGKNQNSFQVTAVWYMNLLHNKVTFDGFADFWKEDNVFGFGADAQKTKFVFLSEPQLWYNCCKNFAVGSEVELGYNFTGNPTKGFHVNPTAALKYTF
ncbi:MAG TPA: DUF5020 domain-containing protein [Prolixibacteraceae bacterium]|jgi:hypothetical protein|nr:DUF5020 domain-containing protein [Prolixibacteraceae bacterium]